MPCRLRLLGWSAVLVLTAVACGEDEPNGPIVGPSDAGPEADAPADRAVDARDAASDAMPDVSVVPEAEAPVDAALPEIVDPRGDGAIAVCADFDPAAKTYTPPGSSHPHCYWWHATGAAWADAESSCEFDRGHLVTIQSAAPQVSKTSATAASTLASWR